MTAPVIIDLDRKTIKQGLAEGTIVLVDVRETSEYAAGHIPGSLSMPLSAFDPLGLPKGRVVLSCAAGIRSARALGIAQMAGIFIQEHYKGGLKDWLDAGEPID